MQFGANLGGFIGILSIFVIQINLKRHEKNTIPVSIGYAALDGLQRPQARDRYLDPCRGTDERIPRLRLGGAEYDFSR